MHTCPQGKQLFKGFIIIMLCFTELAKLYEEKGKPIAPLQ